MLQQLFLKASEYPKRVFFGVFLLTLVFGLFITRIVIDTDPENMLPSSQADRVFHNQVKHRFDVHDMIVVGGINENGIYNPKSLQALVSLTDQISGVDGVVVHDLMSLSNVDNIRQSAEGGVRFEWMMKSAPIDPAAISLLSTQVDRLPLLKNTLVSEDHKASLIYVPIKDKNESHRIAGEIKEFIANLDSADEYHITGLPVAEDTFGYQMFVQMGVSAPLAALMICVLLWWFFRNHHFVVAPMIIAMATVIITMGTMIGSGFTVHIMSSMIPIFLMPIAVVDSIHVLSEFADGYDEEKDKDALMGQVVSHLFRPMLFTSLTSAAGFFSLMLTPIPPVQVFGAFVGIGILLAFVLTLLIIPAYIASIKAEKIKSLARLPQGGRWLGSLLAKTGVSIGGARWLIILGFVAVTVIGALGIRQIQINDNPVRWFKADHPIRVADHKLNTHFAGTYDAFVVLESDYHELQQVWQGHMKGWPEPVQATVEEAMGEGVFPQQLLAVIIEAENQLFESEDSSEWQAVLNLAEQLRSDVAYFQSPLGLKVIEGIQVALSELPEVGKTNALPDMVKTVNRELGASGYTIPESQAAVAQVLLQYQSSHRPHDLWHFVTQDYDSSLIWLQLRSGDNQQMQKVIEGLDAYLKEQPLPSQVSLKWAGKTHLNQVWQNEMVAGMADSLLGAFLVVFLMMVLLFRSVIFGLLAMLPLSITIVSIYGLIGWLGKDYDMPIAVLSALTLGLSVDFAIHFIQRYRDISKKQESAANVIRLMFAEPATAISRNALVITLGFTPLLLAPLMPYVTVGVFLAAIMLFSALVTLLLLPAVLSFFKGDKG